MRKLELNRDHLLETELHRLGLGGWLEAIKAPEWMCNPARAKANRRYARWRAWQPHTQFIQVPILDLDGQVTAHQILTLGKCEDGIPAVESAFLLVRP